MLGVYTSLSQLKMAYLNFPLNFLTNAIRIQAPKLNAVFLCRIGVLGTLFILYKNPLNGFRNVWLRTNIAGKF